MTRVKTVQEEELRQARDIGEAVWELGAGGVVEELGFIQQQGR